MTACALWSNAVYPATPAGLAVFDSTRLNVTVPTTASGRVTAWVATPKTSGRWRMQYQWGNNPGGTAFIGIADTSTSLNASGNPPNCFAITQGGTLYYISGGTLTTVATFAALNNGDYIQFEWDTGAGAGTSGTKQIWARTIPISTGSPNYWNGSATASPNTNVGGYATPAINSFIPFIQAVTGLTGTGITINTGGSPYAFTMDSTFSDLPVTLSITVPPAAYEGSAASFSWQDSNAGTLQYILDAGAPTNATGTTTGSGGVASTSNTFGSIAAHSLALTDGANTLDVTPADTFWTPANPGGDAVLVSTFGTLIGGIGGPPPRPFAEGTFAPSSSVIFSLLVNDVYTVQAGDVALNGEAVIYATNQAEPFFQVNYLDEAGGTLVCSFDTYAAPTSGSNSFTVTGAWGVEGDTVSSLCTGTITVTSISGTPANPFGNMSVTHPGGTTVWTNVRLSSEAVTSVDCIETWFLQSATGFMPYGLSIYGSAETLALTYASCVPGGTLSVGGSWNNGPVLALNISTDNGSTFHSAASYSPSGTLATGNYSATNGTLAAGTYTLFTQDANSLVISNSYELIVAAPVPLLTITSVEYDNAILFVDGSDTNETLTTLSLSLDAGTFTLASSLSVTDALYDSTLNGTIAVGTHTIQSENVVTGTQSNIVTFVVTSPVPPNPDICDLPPPSPTLGRYRGAVGINYYGKTLIGDAFSGVIGQASFDTFLEYGNTMRALVIAPPIHQDRKRVFVPRLEIDVQAGVGQPECCGSNPHWMLDWSKDGGQTWGPQQIVRSIGRIGEYQQRLRWLRLGQSRQWVFRLQSTDPVRRVIIGTYADIYAGMGATG